MAVRSHDNQTRAFGRLLWELAEGSTSLIRHEVRLARIELTAGLRGVAAGAVLVTFGTVLLLLGGVLVIIGLILLGGDQWLRDRYWLAALIIFLAAGGLALVFASRGASLLSPRQLAPDETAATLKEDTAWLKRQLTSGATSS